MYAPDAPNHCDECGAWLADQRDVTKHHQWHQRIYAVEQAAYHADAFHRLYKGKPAP